MKLLFVAVVVAAALVAPSAAAPPPWRVTLDGVEGARPGLTLAQVERRWRLDLRLDEEFPGPCLPARLAARGADGYLIFLNRRLDSVYFRRGAVTGRGIRIGSTLAQVRRAYRGLLTSRGDAYVPGARNYFVRRARAPRWELRIDVSPRGRVTQIAFGGESVRYTEGCA